MQKEISHAINAFKEGKLVAIPTETVYGLAAPIDSEAMVGKIFELKERPFFDPLIVHVSSIEMARSLCLNWASACDILANTFWPGPITMVVNKASHVSDLITSGLKTVGIRLPSHPLAQELIKKMEVPLAAPSANKFKKTSPTKAHDVSEVFDEKDVFVLDGGDCEVGIESTIVYIHENEVTILRPGIIDKNQLGETLGEGFLVKENTDKALSSPGNMQDHYMPQKPLILVDESCALTFENKIPLELPDNPLMAARVLYSKLRECSKAPGEEIYCLVKQSWMSDPTWSGVIDRLLKASTRSLINS